MKTPVKILIGLGVAVAAAGTMVLKRSGETSPVAASNVTVTTAADWPPT